MLKIVQGIIVTKSKLCQSCIEHHLSCACAVHLPEVRKGVAQLLQNLQLPAADVPLVQQLATAKQVPLILAYQQFYLLIALCSLVAHSTGVGSGKSDLAESTGTCRSWQRTCYQH